MEPARPLLSPDSRNLVFYGKIIMAQQELDAPAAHPHLNFPNLIEAAEEVVDILLRLIVAVSI